MQDVLEVVQAEELKSINLLGFSDGANIAMLLASKYPTRINRLILNAGNSTYAGLYALVRFTVKFLNICAHMLRRPSPAFATSFRRFTPKYERIRKKLLRPHLS